MSGNLCVETFFLTMPKYLSCFSYIVDIFQSRFSQDSNLKLRQNILFTVWADFNNFFLLLLGCLNIYKLILLCDLASSSAVEELQQTSPNWSQDSIPIAALSGCGIPYVKLFSLLPNLYITDKVSQLPGYNILASSLMGKWLCFKGLSTHTFVSL